MYGEQGHSGNRELWPGWEVVRLIGKGSFGSVYEIRRELMGNEESAALKVITIPQNSSDIEEMYGEGYDEESITATFQEHLKSIINEYSLMRKLNGSANVVSCDDVRYIQHENGMGWDIYIKMELLTPLTRALPQQIPEETAIHVGIDLCHALELCKKHDIIHRDIKPQNIFVSDNGDYKLGDFGIAKTVEKTMGGTKVGTYKYMAPEVYNNQPYGGAADIYSLGMVLYWLLNERRMPFTPLPPAKLAVGVEETARTRRLAGEPLPAPAHGSDSLKQIVLKACAFDQKDRYSDPAQMREALEDVLSEMKGKHFAKPAAFTMPLSEQQREEKTVGGAYTFRTPSQSAQQKPASLEERKARMAEIYGQEERTEGVHYTPTPALRVECEAEPAPVAPDSIPDDETTQGAWNTPVQAESESKAKQESSQPKSYKKLIDMIAAVAAVLVLAVALWRASPAGSAAQSASNQATVTVCPTFQAPTAKPTSEPTAKPMVETVTFGNYPQTASGTDNTPIEWLVLARDGDKVLLLSRYGLDTHPYNFWYETVTWKECALRTWLNDTFYNKAFTAAEQKAIETTTVSNAKDQGYSGWSTSGGNNTQDKVFLLSYAEANKYLGVTDGNSMNTKAQVVPTEYAIIAQGAHTSSFNKTSDGKEAGYWWLRSPGYYLSRAANVDADGSLNFHCVDKDYICVRPALWVKIEAVKH